MSGAVPTVSIEVMDMTPVAAEAVREVARLTHTEPAREATRQERERTKQQFAQLGVIYLAIVFFGGLLVYEAVWGAGNISWYIAAIILLGFVGRTDVAKVIREVTSQG